jgi:hypothetical protein
MFRTFHSESQFRIRETDPFSMAMTLVLPHRVDTVASQVSPLIPAERPTLSTFLHQRQSLRVYLVIRR